MWVEICSDSEDDWQETLALFGDSFKDSAPFLIPGLTEEERAKFTHEYFKYIYQTEMSNGRAGLICLKERNEDGSVSIVYSSCAVHKIDPHAVGDTSALKSISLSAADNTVRDEEWLANEVHSKFLKASKDLRIPLMYANIEACRRDRMHSGIGRKYANSFLYLLYQNAVRRGYYHKDKAVISYYTVDDISALRFQEKQGDTLIAHLHMGTAACGMEDPSLVNDGNCVHVFARVINGELDVKKELSPYFEQYRPKFSGKL